MCDGSIPASGKRCGTLYHLLSASEGLQRDREVIATGSGIKVPVGDCTLGRLFNVLGDTVDGGEQLDDAEHWVIHRDPPSFEEQKPAVEILETKSSTRLPPCKGARSTVRRCRCWVRQS